MRALGPFTQKQEGPVLSRLWDGDSVSPPLWPDVGQCRGVTTWAKVHNSLWGALGMAEGGDRGNKPSCNAGGGRGAGWTGVPEAWIYLHHLHLSDEHPWSVS